MKKCYNCGSNHLLRYCPIQNQISKYIKNEIGFTMEHFIGNNIKCPECNSNKLIVISKFVPSLDLICNDCYKIYEVKSKCLSINNLPNDIIIKHGSYTKFLNKISEGLNLIIIIYSVNRNSKTLYIREVLYANNNDIKNPNILYFNKHDDSNLTTIFIDNKNKLPKLEFKALTNFI